MSERDESRDEPLVVLVSEERLRVDKRQRVRGGVRVDKRVRTEPVRVEEALTAEEVVVERVPVDRWVDEAPKPYHDGDTWVLPVVEEVLVTERRLRVREEIRVTRRTTTRTEILELERRIEEVEVHRTAAPEE